MRSDRYITDDEIRNSIRAKKRKRRRIISSVLIVMILGLSFASANYLGKNIGNRKYEKEIETVKVVDTSVPIVNTAMQQIGNHGGAPYWSWYGFGSRVAWCACFVSWCESQNGYLSKNLAPKFASTNVGISWFKSKGQWKSAKEVPEAGDIVFFDWEQDNSDDHVGIVIGTSDDRIYTVEGNSSDMCRIKSYEIGSKVLIGYGHIEAN